MKTFFHGGTGPIRILSVATALVTGVAFGANLGTAVAATSPQGSTVSQTGSPLLSALPSGVPDEVQETLTKLERNSRSLEEDFDRGESGLTQRLTESARSSIASGVVETHLPAGAKFDAQAAVTYIPKSDNGLVTLRLPVAGGGLAAVSALGVTFDVDTGSVVSTSEMLFSSREDNSAQATVWNNGELSLNKVVSAEGTVREADFTPPTNVVAAADGFWGRLNNCLASLGIGWALVTAITVACSAACVVTAGTGCMLCIIAAAGVTNANIAGCVAEASQG